MKINLFNKIETGNVKPKTRRLKKLNLKKVKFKQIKIIITIRVYGATDVMTSIRI